MVFCYGWLVGGGRLAPLCPYALMPHMVGWLVEAGWFFYAQVICTYCQEMKMSLLCHSNSRLNHIIHLISNGLLLQKIMMNIIRVYLSTWHNICISLHGITSVSLYMA
ncbi:hypothetical protein BDB01DRAFT_84816 [Pilobolus umbonatus]|nr:hypothetical protein BDB01DRAFT_84816 [Pilobolus umbonatus]